jgi:hypothetical protein
MIKLIIITTFIIYLDFSSIAQPIIEIYKNDICELKTNGNDATNGVKIRMLYPCEWAGTDNVRPGTLIQYSYYIDETTYITQNINFRKISALWDWSTMSMVKGEEIIRKTNLEKGIKLESFKQISIDLLKSIECKSSIIIEAPVGKKYGYVIQYIIPYKYTSITITFGVTANSLEMANQIYELYVPLFKYLADKTVVLSQWE